MSMGRRSIITATFILVSRVIALTINIAVVLLVTRYLGAEGFGNYAFVMGFSLVIGTLATGGIHAIMIRETVRDRSRSSENLGASLQVQAVYTLVAGSLALIVLPLFTGQARVLSAAYISVSAAIVQVLANLFAWVFTAFEDTRYMALSVLLERGLFLAGIILVVSRDLGFLSIFWVQLISFSFKFLFCSLIVNWRFTRIRWNTDPRRFRFFFRESMPLLFSTGFRTVDTQLDTFLLQLFQTAAQLGLYGAPFRVISSIAILPDSIMAGMLPALSNLVQSNRSKAFLLYSKLFKYFLIASVPITLIVASLSTPLMILLFGHDYAEGGRTLALMVWIVVFMFPNHLFQYLLTALGMQRSESMRLAISLAVHIGVGLVLVPAWGAAGGAASMLIAQFVAFVVGYIQVNRAFGFYWPRDTLVRLTVGALPALAVIILLGHLHVVVQLLLSGLVYLVALVILRAFSQDEIDLIMAALWPHGKPLMVTNGLFFLRKDSSK